MKKGRRATVRMSDIEVVTDKNLIGDGDHMIAFVGQAQGALPTGSRIVKCNSAAGDHHRDGARGTILGSIAYEGLIGYSVEWDDTPNVPVGIVGHRLRPLD